MNVEQLKVNENRSDEAVEYEPNVSTLCPLQNISYFITTIFVKIRSYYSNVQL